MNANLREQLKELRLSGLSQSLEVRLQEARSSKLDYAEFLELILEDEMVTRRDRQIDRRIKAVAFRDQKSLDDFDFNFNTTVKRKQIFDLAAGDFVRKHRDAILVGPPGVGKSHLSQSIARQLIRDGYKVYYRSIFDCVRDFLHDEAFEGHERILNRYLKPDLLILDDMGMKQLPKKSGEFLFEIVMRRHELRSTMMTSNRPLEDWGKLIGDVPAATAIPDRFLESAEVIQITGRSFRLHGIRPISTLRCLRKNPRKVAQNQPLPKPAKPAHRVRSKKPIENPANYATHSSKPWPVLPRAMTHFDRSGSKLRLWPANSKVSDVATVCSREGRFGCCGYQIFLRNRKSMNRCSPRDFAARSVGPNLPPTSSHFGVKLSANGCKSVSTIAMRQTRKSTVKNNCFLDFCDCGVVAAQ